MNDQDAQRAAGSSAPDCSVNWSADTWFAIYHTACLTEEFKAWWLGCYGCPDYYDGAEDEQHEYWIRCAFALRGWLAARTPNDRLHGRERSEAE
jgi:hypothetical protein